MSDCYKEFSADKTGPLLTIAVAVAQNGVIGAAGDLPWRISSDLQWFKRRTMGKPIIMGRKTYDSIGKPLPGRQNIVVSSQADLNIDGAVVVGAIEAAVEAATEAALSNGNDEICVIGGARIYEQVLPQVDRIYLTRVLAAPEGDAFFPPIDMVKWRKALITTSEISQKDQYPCEYFIFDRQKSGI